MGKLRTLLLAGLVVLLFSYNNAFSQSQNSAVSQNPSVKIWKTINLGTPDFKSADDFRKEIKDSKIQLTEDADDILNKPEFSVAKTETKVELVVLTVGDMGFPDGTFGEDIYKKAEKLGLKLCPAEVGPQLRIQYKDQEFYENLAIGMKPIKNSKGELSAFSVDHTYRGRQLDANWGDPKAFWNGPKWVFCK